MLIAEHLAALQVLCEEVTDALHALFNHTQKEKVARIKLYSRPLDVRF